MGFLSYCNNSRGFTAIGITAAASVLALMVVLGWSVERSVQEKKSATTYVASADAGTDISSSKENVAGMSIFGSASFSSATSSTDAISSIGAVVMDRLAGQYAQMQQAGTYTEEAGAQIAQDLAPLMRAEVSYRRFTKADVKTSSDTSYAAMLAYRLALQSTLKPLFKNTTPEYEIFGNYVQTKDASYLKELTEVAKNYKDAAASTANVAAPADAVVQHLAILNAMQEFAATLEQLVAHAEDPFASVALLRSYDQAERNMFTSFSGLYSYNAKKQL